VRGDRAVSLGASGDLARTFGADPARTRLTARLRGEGAWARYDDAMAPGLALGTPEGGRRSAPYARGMAEATVSRPLGPLAASVTGAAGALAGARVPAQRLFYVGGLQTVRGQFARPFGAGYAGTAFWLARTELGLDATGVRPVVFYDAGWAGPRERFGRPGRPLSGAGVGASFLDGLVRADLSRGIAPERRWRLDLSLDARF
jgi:hemolysin activation/secretion protein